jgi:hypothetical protein
VALRNLKGLIRERARSAGVAGLTGDVRKPDSTGIMHVEVAWPPLRDRSSTEDIAALVPESRTGSVCLGPKGPMGWTHGLDGAESPLTP